MAKNVEILKPFEVESIYLTPGAANGTIDEGDYGVPAYVHNIMGGAGQNIPYWQIEFDCDAEERSWWEFTLPRNFLKQHQVNVKLYWICDVAWAAETGNVVWAAGVLGRKECEAFDAIFEEADEVTVVDAVHEDAKKLIVTTITIPPAKHKLEEMDVVVLRVARKATDPADTHDGEDAGKYDADLVMVDFEFAVDPEIVRGF